VLPKRGDTAHSKRFANFARASEIAKRVECGVSRRFGFLGALHHRGGKAEANKEKSELT